VWRYEYILFLRGKFESVLGSHLNPVILNSEFKIELLVYFVLLSRSFLPIV
jgi:hypothetical protein